ncbi:SWI/SNF and RSC complex subunit Ssr2 [Coemansia sp. RSA 552]|nr:SWI/SNF and RSC complex subunit Ssr2 [Coemansia sp. RSA 552]
MATRGPAHKCQRESWATYYASADVAGQFAGIVDSLVTEAEIAASTAPGGATAPEITDRLLSQLTNTVQIAQENVYGQNGSESGKGVKLPADLFVVPDDGVKEQSPLYNVLSTVVEYAINHGIKLGGDGADTARLESGQSAREMLDAVRLKLGDNRQLPVVRVYLEADIPAEQRAALSDTVRALGGDIASSSQEATHVVDASSARSDSQASDEVWFRTLKKRSGLALVHWWYTPDSYDAWVAAEAPYTADPEAPPEHSGAWRVSQQWIADSGRFHEWLNEEDYESAAPAGGAVGGVKRRAHVVAEGEEKRLRADGDNGDLPAGVQALNIHETQPFFNGRNMSKTPTVYMEYRNFMVNSYRLNPVEYLTVTACRRNLAGDVCAIMRVHAFLEQWGLINYQVDAETKPSTIGPPFTGHFRVSADTPRGLVPFQPSISAANLAGADKPSTSSPRPPQLAESLTARKDIYASPTIGSEAKRPAREVNASEEPPTTKDVFCHTCGVNCTSAYYHCAKALRQRVDLCPPCYQDGRFPGTLSSADFVRITEATAGQPGSGDSWSDQETLLLLEGIEMFDDDWNRIGEHVGTRSREECVLHFLKLPIEDPYEVAPLKDSAGAQSAVVPFSRADNPVMSVVAFLASNVSPGVASAAAKAALAELTKSGEKASAEKKASEENRSEDKASEEKASGEEPNGVEAAEDKQSDKETSGGMDVDDKDGDSEKPEEEKSVENAVPRGSELSYASSVALGAAAAKAAKLAEYEERQLESMVHRAVELQMSKLELKMRQFEEMEAAVEQERKDLARQRQQLVEECWALKKKMGLFESGAAAKIAAASSGNVFKADDNAGNVTRGPTAPPKALDVSAPDQPVAASAGPSPSLPTAPAIDAASSAPGSTAAAAAAVVAAAAVSAAASTDNTMDVDDGSSGA